MSDLPRFGNRTHEQQTACAERRSTLKRFTTNTHVRHAPTFLSRSHIKNTCLWPLRSLEIAFVAGPQFSGAHHPQPHPLGPLYKPSKSAGNIKHSAVCRLRPYRGVAVCKNGIRRTINTICDAVHSGTQVPVVRRHLLCPFS
jgi:hypothetical protein